MLREPLSDNLPFNFKGATERSAPFHFTAPCHDRGSLADFANNGALNYADGGVCYLPRKETVNCLRRSP